MNTKLVAKWMGLVLLLTISFCAGYYISAVNLFWKSVNLPQIESETKARNCIHSKFNLELPDNATHLYYAGRGFVDPDYYAAFSLSSAEACETFIKKQLDVKLEDFKEITELPEDFLEHDPGTWEKEYQDPAWDLTKAGKYLLCERSYYRSLIYAPEKNRFYLHRQG